MAECDSNCSEHELFWCDLCHSEYLADELLILHAFLANVLSRLNRIPRNKYNNTCNRNVHDGNERPPILHTVLIPASAFHYAYTFHGASFMGPLHQSLSKSVQFHYHLH